MPEELQAKASALPHCPAPVSVVEALDALHLVVVGLGDGGVGLVAAGGADALVLVVDVGRRVERLLQPAGADERRRPPDAVDLAAPPRGCRSSAPGSPPARSAPSGRAAPGRRARPAAWCPGAAAAAAASAGRPGCCTTGAGCLFRPGKTYWLMGPSSRGVCERRRGFESLFGPGRENEKPAAGRLQRVRTGVCQVRIR